MIKNFGDTANGKVSGSMPNGNLSVPQWKNVDVVGNLINMYYANEKNNRENEILQLAKNNQSLNEQMFAYRAFNDEISRQMSLKLQEIQNQGYIDKIILENRLKNENYNKLKAEDDLKEKKNNQYYGLLESLADLGTDISNPHNFFTAARAYAKASGLTDVVDFYTNNGAEAAKLNNLFMQNYMDKNVAGDSIKGYSRNSNSSDPFDFNNNRTQNK